MALVIAFVGWSSAGSGAQPGMHDCHVYAVDLAEGEKLLRQMMAHPDTNSSELQKTAQKVEKILGKFKAEVGEEVATTRSYQLPGTDLTVTATVFYTDESMDLSDSILLGLVIAKGSVDNAIQAPGASVAEVNYEKTTYKVRATQRLLIQGRPWVVGLECQCMSAERREQQLKVAPGPNGGTGK